MEGKESVAITTGFEGKAKGALGCWIVVAERDSEWKILCVKTGKIDGKKLKPGIFYTVKGGKFVEAKN